MSDDWQIEGMGKKGADGVIEHRAAPRFRALWSTGLEDLTGLEGLFWTEEGHDEADAITLHHFRFEGSPPDQATFEALMREAVRKIDGWIARRL